MQKVILALLLGIFSVQGYTQNRNLDSLINSLKTNKFDSNYYKSCIEIASIYTDSAYDKSLIYYNKALDIAEKSSDRKKVAHVYHQIGYMFQRKGEFPTALANFNNALEIHQYLNNKKGIGQLLNDIGLIYRTWGKYDQALDNYFKALRLFDEIGDAGNGAMASNNIGQIYFYRTEYEKAIEYFKKYLDVNKKSNKPRAVAGASNNIASAYMELKRYDDALSYFVRSMRIYDSLGIKLGVAVIKDNIGSLFLRKEQYNDALLYHTDAAKFFEETGSQPRLCASLQNIGLAYTKLNNPVLAVKYLNRSLEIALKLKQKETQKDVYEALSDVYSQNKNWDKAFVNYKQFVQLNDSLLNVETIGKIETIQAEYESQKKEKELAEINQKLHNQKIVLLLSAALFVIFAFLVLLIIRENFHKKRTIENSVEKTKNLYSILSKTGQYYLNFQNSQFLSSSVFEKMWSICPKGDPKHPYLTFEQGSKLFFAYGSSENPQKCSNVIYLSIIDYFYSTANLTDCENLKEQYFGFISKESKWKEVFDGVDWLNVDFWIFDRSNFQLLYFGNNKAFIVDGKNQIIHLKNNENRHTVVKGDKFYVLASGANSTDDSSDQRLLRETLSKTILNTIAIPFENQYQIFSDSLELINAGDEYQNDISIFAFKV